MEGSHKYIRRVIAHSGNPSLCQTTEQSIACTKIVMDALGCKTVADLQYDTKDRYVMVFDEFNVHAQKEEELNIVDWDRTYFLTKYYVL